MTLASPSGTAGTRHGADWEATCTAWAYQTMVIQRILRHANVSTTATYYIKTAADDVRSAMAKLEKNTPSANQTPKILRDTFGTLNLDSTAVPSTMQ